MLSLALTLLLLLQDFEASMSERMASVQAGIKDHFVGVKRKGESLEASGH